MNNNILDCPMLEEPTATEINTIAAHFAEQRLDQLEDAATGLIERMPKHGFGWKVLGVVRYMQQQDNEALIALERAASYLSEDAELRRNLASVLFRMRHLNEALKQCHAALTLNPQDALSYALLGQIFQTQHNYVDAAQAYCQALNFSPKNLRIRSALALVLMYLGDLPHAAQHLRDNLKFRLQSNTVSTNPLPSSRLDLPEYEKLLWQTLVHLAKNGIHAFVTAGTLLGLIREGKLLAFDKDFDIALPFSEMDLACTHLKACGWNEEPNPMRLINPRSFRHPELLIVLDLCGIMPDKQSGKIIGGFWQAGQPWSSQRITEFPDPLLLHVTTSPEGPVWALNAPEAWLEALYGDWRTPNPDFDTVVGALNLRGFSLLTECYALARINEHWQEGRLHKALSVTRHVLRHFPNDALLNDIVRHLNASLELPAMNSDFPKDSSN